MTARRGNVELRRLGQDGVVVALRRDKVDLEAIARRPGAAGVRDLCRVLRVGRAGRLFLNQRDGRIVKETRLQKRSVSFAVVITTIIHGRLTERT